MPILDTFENKVIPVLSLSKFDSAWISILNESGLFKIWLNLKSLFQDKIKLATMGYWFDVFSFALVMLLFLILPMPQFADDKAILASVVMCATGLRFMGMLLSRQVAYSPCAIDMLVLAFAGMNVIATASSYYPVQSLIGLSKMAVYFCSYFLFIGVLQTSTEKRTYLIVGSLLASAILVSLYGLYQYKIGVAPLATWVDPTDTDHSTRVFSTLKNPNLLAGYLVPLVPLSFSLVLMSFFQKDWKKYLMLPALGVAGLITGCCFLTRSRGGWLGMAAGMTALLITCAYYLWVNKPRFRPVILISILISPLVVLAGIHMNHTFEHRVLTMFAGREDSSNSYRMNVWISSINLFKDNWWLGVGPGNSTFKLIYGIYMRSGFDALGAYCVPLEVAVETGIFGLFAFLGIIMSTMSRAHEQFWHHPFGPERWIKAGAAAGLLGMMIHGMVDTVYYRPQVQLIFWLLLAMCIVSPKTNGQDESASASRSISTDESETTGESAA